MSGLRIFFKEMDGLNNSKKMPLLFVGHGSPMNAIEENKYSKTWKELGESLPVPKAILSVSAHWLSHGTTKVAAMPWPETIHDFGGFPKELFNVQYSAPGSPDFAEQTIKLLQSAHVEADLTWGLDHGTWSVLVNMYPQANIPVYQLSIDFSKPPEYHYKLMNDLKILRTKGVLVMGSGNIVHNLSMLQMSGEVFPWTIEFDTLISGYIDKGDYQSVVDFQKSGTLARLAHPTYDHFLPLLYTLGMADKDDRVNYFNEGFEMGSISMRSLLIANSQENS